MPIPPGKMGKDAAGRPYEVTWTPEEDAALFKTIHAYGSGNWELVADIFASRRASRSAASVA